MNINRNNYEEFFMLYADNELTAAERKTIEAFIAANPDLREELAMFYTFKLNPDTEVVFADKEMLMKHDSEKELVNASNYESFFILYADNELNADQKTAVEEFVYHNPKFQSEFELIQEIKLVPDTNIIFENKESLYRKEEDDKVVPFRWWRIAVAAMVLLMAGLLWVYQSSKNSKQDSFVNTKNPVTNPKQQPLHIKEKKKITDTNSNVQPEKEEILVKGVQKENQQIKKAQAIETAVVKNKVNKPQGKNNNSDNLVIEPHEDAVVDIQGSRLTGSRIDAIKQTEKEVDINTGFAAAASKSVINQQLIYQANTVENGKTDAEQAAYASNSNVEVLNTSVDTKNSLRGFFRKASRIISKKNSSEDEDSKRKSILIGGFEIAVR